MHLARVVEVGLQPFGDLKKSYKCFRKAHVCKISMPYLSFFATKRSIFLIFVTEMMLFATKHCILVIPGNAAQLNFWYSESVKPFGKSSPKAHKSRQNIKSRQNSVCWGPYLAEVTLWSLNFCHPAPCKYAHKLFNICPRVGTSIHP